jgi:hypothetical protein
MKVGGILGTKLRRLPLGKKTKGDFQHELAKNDEQQEVGVRKKVVLVS